MKLDQKGFLHPAITEKLCIWCYQYMSVCAFKKAQKIKGFDIFVKKKKWIDIIKNEKISSWNI